ncbi:MAG TPA: hypothetical protein VHK67_00445 [Rhabdochlamydiaceae bacterium]|jgi:hypothetical protein|nr:hypothetical protein [Rhabdochlamydiaceae bacterium]
MASPITSFHSQATWHAMGICLLPLAADQLVRRIFAKKLSAYKLEAASLVTSAVTYLLLSHQLLQSFTIAPALVFLAYKAAQFYFSMKAPPSSEKSKLLDSSSLEIRDPLHSPYQPHEPTISSPESPVTITNAAAVSITETSTTSTPAPEETPQQKAAADRLAADVESVRQATLKFMQIIDPFQKSQIMSLKVQLKPINAPVEGQKKLKAKEIKAQIRFGDTHVFKMDKPQVESLNRKGYTVPENTLFFWIDVADKTERLPSNFIPLKMLDDLKSNTKEFSLRLTEKDYHWTLTFKGNQLARLTTFAQTIRKCRKVEVIHNGIVIKPSDETAALECKILEMLSDNDLAAANRLKCYIEVFKKG